MTGISDQFTTIGNEAVAWGTAAATLTRGIEAKPGNKPVPRVEHVVSQGFRPGYLGNPTDTARVDLRGGTYSLAFDLLSKSHSLALATISDAVTITTPSGGTDARLHTITPSDRAIRSTSILDAVALEDGTIDYVSFLGGKATALSMSVNPKGNVEVKIDFDYKTANTTASSVSPAYPSSPYVYRDTDITVSIGGTDTCVRSLDFTIPTGVKTDLDRICTGGREEPVVVGRIAPTGTVAVDFASVGYLDDWLAGTPRALVYTITGPNIEGSLDYEVTVTFPAVKFTGDAYDRSLTDLTVQSLPWQAFDNGTDPIWTITYQTTDTAA